MPRRWSVAVLGLGLLVLVQTGIDAAAIPRTVRLRNAFIDHIKNRATIKDLPFKVDHVKKSINAISKGAEDGDLHVAGRPGNFVAMPMVAEVVNAKREKDDVVKRFRDVEGTNKPASVTGVWRFWFEHPPKTVMVQGGTVPIPNTTNPDHVFELHPVTAIDGHDADLSFGMIPGYEAYTAEVAFKVYERLQITAKRGSTFTTMTGTQVGYNYTQFNAVLAGKFVEKNDAIFVLADIVGKNGKSVVTSSRRLVFTAGTTSADRFKAMNPKKGTKLVVQGIPRVNLDVLMDAAMNEPGQPVTVKGAYEIIVIGIK